MSSHATPHALSPGKPSLSPWLLVGAAVSALGLLYVPFLIARAPIEPVMGPVQKIFYFHVPCAWLLLVSTLVAGGGSLAYLFKGSAKGDRLALAAAELGAVFGIAALVSGPLWGKVAWGKYWTWDARQTSTLLLWLVLLAYLLARKYGGPAARKLAAALALFAAADVPLVYASVRIWRTLHPDNSVVKTLDAAMRPAFYSSLLVLTVFWGVLLALRLRLEDLRAGITDLHIAVEDAEEANS
jgi:heme exporter protein C